MMHSAAVRLRVLVGAFAVLCARPALAEDPSCSPMPIEVDASVSARWPGLVKRVREALDARDDIDTCARITLRRSDASVVVQVVLTDGRSASRSVSRRDDIVPTIEALLLVPQRLTAPETSSRDASLSPAAPVPETSASGGDASALPPSVDLPFRAEPAPLARETGARTPADPASHLRIELSVLSGARIGDGQTSFGLGAFSLVDVDGWLVGFEGRADRYQTMAPGPDRPAVELAALGGRRFRFGALALDVTGGPSLALHGGTATSVVNNTSASAQTGVSTTPQTISRSGESTVPRLLVGTRLIFGARSWLRIFVGVDGELGPASASDPVFPGEHSLPVWTLGLALGATVGTL
jgi:hypothetical protein